MDARTTSKPERRPLRGIAAVLGIGVLVYAAAALWLYAFQARLVYLPELPSRQVQATPADVGLAFEPVALATGDGETLAGWFVPAPQARGTLLYLHGNGGNIGHRVDRVAVFQRLGLNTLIVDYRGYGASSGEPSEAGTYRDALAAWDHLTRVRGESPARIVVFGESLGGSIAAWLAARRPPAALVVYASFTSAPELARSLYPMFPAAWLTRFRYDTRAALGHVAAPVLILHSPDDEIVPFSHGEALFAAARGPKKLVELRGGHLDADVLGRAIYVREIGAFLQRVLDGADGGAQVSTARRGG